MRPEKFRSLALTFLRLSLAVVFIWFGLLKLFNVSPVFDVIAKAYPFIAANPSFYLLLAVLEITLGIGIIISKISAITAWIMMGHLFVATLGVLFSPQAFAGAFPMLSIVGEFVVKNIVLVAAAMVVAST